MFTYSSGYPRWLPDDLYTTIALSAFYFLEIRWHIDTHLSEMHTYFTLIICPSTRQHFGNKSVLFHFYVDDKLTWRMSKEIKLHSKKYRRLSCLSCQSQASYHLVFHCCIWAGSNPIRIVCEKATLCLQMVRWFLMENFLFCSIYLLAMAQESEIILTAWH